MPSAKYLLSLAFSLFIWTAVASACPDKCVCNDGSVNCTNVDKNEFDQILATLSASPVNHLSIRNCASPLGRVDSLPPDFRTRSLDISACGVTDFGSDAFKYLSDDLIELRLSNNNLTSLPFLQNLRRLEVLNLNKNSVLPLSS